MLFQAGAGKELPLRLVDAADESEIIELDVANRQVFHDGMQEALALFEAEHGQFLFCDFAEDDEEAFDIALEVEHGKPGDLVIHGLDAGDVFVVQLGILEQHFPFNGRFMLFDVIEQGGEAAAAVEGSSNTLYGPETAG